MYKIKPFPVALISSLPVCNTHALKNAVDEIKSVEEPQNIQLPILPSISHGNPKQDKGEDSDDVCVIEECQADTSMRCVCVCVCLGGQGFIFIVVVVAGLFMAWFIEGLVYLSFLLLV